MDEKDLSTTRLASFLHVRWEDCYQINPSSMICYLPTAIEGACKVSADHALFSNVFSQSRILHFGICIDEFQGTLTKGGMTSHRDPIFLMNAANGSYSFFPFDYTPGEKAFYQSQQMAYVPPHQQIQKLTITLTNDGFEPLVWDQTNFPTLSEYKFNLLLKIKHL
jgi:hypothetical protein